VCTNIPFAGNVRARTKHRLRAKGKMEERRGGEERGGGEREGRVEGGGEGWCVSDGRGGVVRVLAVRLAGRD